MQKWMKRIVSITLIAVMTLGFSTAAMASSGASTHDAHFTFTDIDEPQADLFVKKTVTPAMEGYTVPDATFTFYLQWDQDGDGGLEVAANVQYYLFDADGSQVLNDTGGTIFHTGSDGSFTLKDGQYAQFEFAGEVDYLVTEEDLDSFINTSGDKSGTVDAHGTYVTFENIYVPISDGGETTQLIIRKDIFWPEGYEVPDFSDMEFTFEVTVDGAPYADEAYAIYDAEVSNQTGSGRTDSAGTFSMAGDSAVVFSDVEVSVDYSVTEISPNDGWRTTGKTSYAGATASPMIYCYFANAGAEFIITKDRTDGAAGIEYSFILSDGTGSPMTGIPYYIYDSNGNITDTGETGADGSFALSSGEKVIFTGIPDGTAYTITENAGSDYEVTVNGTAGSDVTATEDYGSVPSYAFVNEELTRLTITKYGSTEHVDENLLSGAEFTAYLLNEDGEYEAYGEPQTTGEDGTLTFYLPAGTYRIVETKTPAGYIALGDPIEVTLPYTSENEVEGAVYSERDDVYYVYQLDYTVDNMATLVMPNTGGNAWILILLAACGGGIALISVYIFRNQSGRKAKVREHE